MVGENIVYRLRNKLYKYVQHANIHFHDKTPSGTLFVRMTSDVEDITTAFKDVVTTFVKDVVMIIAFACMMITLNYKLSLICFILIPLVILTSFIMNKISRKVQESIKKAKTQLNIFLSESIYGVKLIKIFSRQDEKNKECENYCNKYYKSRVPTSYVEAFLVGIMYVFKNLGISTIVWVCMNHLFDINLEVRNNLCIYYIFK